MEKGGVGTRIRIGEIGFRSESATATEGKLSCLDGEIVNS